MVMLHLGFRHLMMLVIALHLLCVVMSYVCSCQLLFLCYFIFPLNLAYSEGWQMDVLF